MTNALAYIISCHAGQRNNTIQYNTIVAWCMLKYKIKNRQVAYYRVSKSYVVLGNARVKK